MTVDADDAAGEDEPKDQFAVVEIFGHRSHAGRISEVEQFGTKRLRIDVPRDGDFEAGFTSHFYGGASIFSMTPCDLATVMRINKPYRPAGMLSYAAEDDRDALDDLDDQDADRPF